MDPSGRAMFGDGRATPAVLTFLRDTRVGRMASLAPREEEWWGEEENSESEGEEGGPGPPYNVFFPCPSSVLSFLFNLFGGIGEKERRRPYYDRFCQSAVVEKRICKKTHRRCFGSGSAAAMALRAACSGRLNKR